MADSQKNFGYGQPNPSIPIVRNDNSTEPSFFQRNLTDGNTNSSFANYNNQWNQHSVNFPVHYPQSYSNTYNYATQNQIAYGYPHTFPSTPAYNSYQTYDSQYSYPYYQFPQQNILQSVFSPQALFGGNYSGSYNTVQNYSFSKQQQDSETKYEKHLF
ncbi:hypothetical protein HK096_010061 [Nowakowskiella sp. JEL0078]|nr:hypothetical protein HK096_010061 [Nowakowskiella sp. JEL0078]